MSWPIIKTYLWRYQTDLRETKQFIWHHGAWCSPPILNEFAKTQNALFSISSPSCWILSAFSANFFEAVIKIGIFKLLRLGFFSVWCDILWSPWWLFTVRTPCGYWLLELWNIEIMKRWRIYNNYTDHMSTPRIDLSYVKFGYNSRWLICVCLIQICAND